VSDHEAQIGNGVGTPTEPGAVSTPAGGEALDASDLAELIGTFNEVTAKLQASHERLGREVTRLRRELGEANEALERSRRLAALGEMAAGIAHEIRNPLGSIGLYARMLEEDLGDRPEQSQTAGKIRLAVQGLERIVRDVLAFAREVRVERARACVDDVIGRAVEAVFAAGSHTGVQVEVSECKGVELDADAGLLVQALTNVLRNAAEAVDEVGGGRVRVEAQRLSEDGRGGAVTVLRVIDDGPGVSPEVVQRMFNPFFTTRAAGTGLGLAIVHRIIDAHGGSVRVRRRDEHDRGADPRRPKAAGHGTVVELVIPSGAREASTDPSSGTDGTWTPAVRTRAALTEHAA